MILLFPYINLYSQIQLYKKLSWEGLLNQEQEVAKAGFTIQGYHAHFFIKICLGENIPNRLETRENC